MIFELNDEEQAILKLCIDHQNYKITSVIYICTLSSNSIGSMNESYMAAEKLHNAGLIEFYAAQLTPSSSTQQYFAKLNIIIPENLIEEFEQFCTYLRLTN